MLRRALDRFLDLSRPLQVVVSISALLVLIALAWPISVVASAIFVAAAAILLVQLLRQKSEALRVWGVVAGASLAVALVFAVFSVAFDVSSPREGVNTPSQTSEDPPYEPAREPAGRIAENVEESAN